MKDWREIPNSKCPVIAVVFNWCWCSSVVVCVVLTWDRHLKEVQNVACLAENFFLAPTPSLG